MAGTEEPGAAGRRWLAFAAWLGVFLTLGALLTSYRYLERVAYGDDVPLAEPLINEMTAAFGSGLLFWAVRAFCRRFPLRDRPLGSRLALYPPALLAYSFLHTSWNWATRFALYPLAGLGPHDYGRMPTRYAMELGMDALTFVFMVAFVFGWERLRAARARELRAAQLEASLARAELRGLRLQLQPHFLFNALNTISATMYENPAAADEMIGRLAELLRASLRQGQADEVKLAEELELLGAYLGLLEARFGERLRVELEVEEACRAVLVPPLLLQPLAENAIRHGRAESEGEGRLRIAARRAGEALELVVENDLPAAAPAPARGSGEGGLGLASVSERLRLLYGERQSFGAGRSGELFRVALRLPWRIAEEA